MTLYKNILIHLNKYGHNINDILWVGNTRQHMNLSIFWNFAQKHDLKSVYKIPVLHLYQYHILKMKHNQITSI